MGPSHLITHYTWAQDPEGLCYGCRKGKDECLENGTIWYVVHEEVIKKQFQEDQSSCSHEFFKYVVPVQST